MLQTDGIQQNRKKKRYGEPVRYTTEPNETTLPNKFNQKTWVYFFCLFARRVVQWRKEKQKITKKSVTKEITQQTIQTQANDTGISYVCLRVSKAKAIQTHTRRSRHCECIR